MTSETDHQPAGSDQSAAAPQPGSGTGRPRLSRHALLAEAFEILAASLGPFIDTRMADYFEAETSWAEAAANRMGRAAEHGAADPLFQLLVLRRFWGPVFADFFGQDLRGIVSELIDVRNSWAHLSLPEDARELDRSILTVERLIAPLTPEATRRLRQLRAQLKQPVASTAEQPDPAAEAEAEGLEVAVEEAERLEAQLSETEAVFRELQDRFEDMESELARSRDVSARKQLLLAQLENQLVEVKGRSLAAEEFLAEERYTRQRLEWLFVGLLATLLLFMVLSMTT